MSNSNQKYDVEIVVSGGCSMGKDKVAKHIAFAMSTFGGFGKVTVTKESNDHPWDGFSCDEWCHVVVR